MENSTKEKESSVQTNDSSNPKPLAVKNIGGKALILRGIIEKITPLSSKYGENHRIEMGGNSYYFPSKVPGTCEKMFKVGDRAAFTVREAPNKNNPNNPFLIIENVFYTF